MKKCKFCRQDIDAKATVCPFCRRKQQSRLLDKLVIVLIVLIVLIFILRVITNYKDENDSDLPSSFSRTKVSDDFTAEIFTEKPIEASKLPHEIKSFSYTINGKYLYFAACFYNPNENYYISIPKCRVTARDENGGILGTDEIGLMGIYPNMEVWDGGLLLSVEKEPTTVDIEIIEPNDRSYVEKSLLKFPDYKEMKVVNTNIVDSGFTKKLVGEIQNDNDFTADCAALTIVFLDESGNPIAADRAFVNDVSANSTTPFETSLYDDFITNNYAVYVDLW